MNDQSQKSCWGITAWAVIGFAGAVALMFLIGTGGEAAIVQAGAG